MKFPIAKLPSNLNLGQWWLRLQRSANVNDLVVGLEILTNNLRSKIPTGKMFTPLCFFCKGTPDNVYIDLKRSLSDLTSGQCKFDLRSMSKKSKLSQDVYHSLVLMGQRCYFVVILDRYKFPQTIPMLHSIV